MVAASSQPVVLAMSWADSTRPKSIASVVPRRDVPMPLRSPYMQPISSRNGDQIRSSRRLPVETQRVLVTGGCGFIGTHLAGELSSRGHEVLACDLRNAERSDAVRCDVREFRQLERVFDRPKFDYVYHLAAEYGRWNGEDHYENLWQSNAIGTKNVVRLQERLKFRLIFFSSAEVYGDYRGEMKEDVMDAIPIKQLNDYAITKWAGELMCLNSAEQFGTETVRVRPVNCYGPGERYTPS